MGIDGISRELKYELVVVEGVRVEGSKFGGRCC